MADLNKKWNIVIRTRGDRNQMLIDTLYSVATQTYKNRSVILILHNASQEAKEEIAVTVKRFKSILEIHTYDLNGGLRGAPLNKALEMIDGDYISFLDDDDVFYPHFGEVLINEIENNDSNFVYGNSIQVLQTRVDNHFGERYFYNTHKYRIFGEEFNRIFILLDNFIPFNTFVVTKKIIGEIKFDENLSVLEDWDFLIQLSLKKDFTPKYLDINVSEYRIRNDGSNSHNQDPKVLETWEKCRKIIKDKIIDKRIEYSLTEIYKLSDDLIKYKHMSTALSLEKTSLERQLALYNISSRSLMRKLLHKFPRVKNFVRRIIWRN